MTGFASFQDISKKQKKIDITNKTKYNTTITFCYLQISQHKEETDYAKRKSSNSATSRFWSYQTE